MALDNKTPAELGGIIVKGSDKWKTLIQQASRNPKIKAGLTNTIS